MAKTLLSVCALFLLGVNRVGLCYPEIETFCYCVVPETVMPDLCGCERKCPCGTLEYFISTGSFGKNYTTFYFLPGNYTLGRVVNVTEGVHNLTMIGNGSAKSYDSSPVTISEPVARILCDSEGDSGFYFDYVDNLTIVNLGFYSCGFSKFGAVMCRSVTNLYMFGVEIKYSRGWGLSCQEVYGTSVISHTCVSHSKSLFNYTGGNVYLV